MFIETALGITPAQPAHLLSLPRRISGAAQDHFRRTFDEDIMKTGFAAPLAIAAFAHAAAAQSGAIHAPCLEMKPDLAAYVAAFEEQGWQQAGSTEDRETALRGPSEIVQVTTRMPRAETLADVITLTAKAHQQMVRHFQGAAVLTRDNAAAAVFEDTRGIVTCYITAPELADLDPGTLAPAAPAPFDYHFETPQPPQGARALRISYIQQNWEAAPDLALAGRQAIIVELARATE